MEKKGPKVMLTMRKTGSNKTMKEVLQERKPAILSQQEKEMICILMPEAEALPYELKEMTSSIGTTEYIYDVPEDAKEVLFKMLFPFDGCPNMDDKLFDIHERKYFTFKECLVTRWNGRNMLVSPYFLSCGGMVVDFLPDENTDTDVKALK